MGYRRYHVTDWSYHQLDLGQILSLARSPKPAYKVKTMKSWKTSLTGILTIVTAIGSAVLVYLKSGVLPDFGVLSAAVMAGVGLLYSRDNNVTSESAGAK